MGAHDKGGTDRLRADDAVAERRLSAIPPAPRDHDQTGGRAEGRSPAGNAGARSAWPTGREQVLLAAIVAVGVALRARQLFVWRSLWLDEAMLALNIVSRSFVGLLRPLDYNQGAPIGFLELQKLAVSILGQTDTALRVVPLLASCASLALFARVAVAWTGASGAVAAALFAVATPLVDFSTEAKQYSMDVFAVVLILSALRPWVAGHATRTRDWLVVASVGTVVPWFSHPAAFVLPGAGLVVLVRSRVAGRAAFAKVAAVAAAWMLSFVVLYEVSLASLASNRALTGYWKSSFAPFGQPQLGAWTAAMFDAYLRDVVAIGSAGAVRVLVAAGTVSMALRRPDLAVALCAPLLFALAASARGLYPFSGRLLLFAVPTTLLLCAEPVGRTAAIAGSVVTRLGGARAGRMSRRAVLAGVALAVLARPLALAWTHVWYPRDAEALRPALEYLVSHREPGEAIYVYYGAKPAVAFYARSLSVPADALVLGRAHRGDPNAYRAEIRRLVTNRTVWVVLSHNCPVCRVDEWRLILNELDTHGRQVDKFETTGAAVYRYRFDAP